MRRPRSGCSCDCSHDRKKRHVCVPGLQIEACKLLRIGPGNHPRKNGVLAEVFFLTTPDFVFCEPAYHWEHVEEESALPGDDDLDFLRERICTGHP